MSWSFSPYHAPVPTIRRPTARHGGAHVTSAAHGGGVATFHPTFARATSARPSAPAACAPAVRRNMPPDARDPSLDSSLPLPAAASRHTLRGVPEAGEHGDGRAGPVESRRRSCGTRLSDDAWPPHRRAHPCVASARLAHDARSSSGLPMVSRQKAPSRCVVALRTAPSEAFHVEHARRSCLPRPHRPLGGVPRGTSLTLLPAAPHLGGLGRPCGNLAHGILGVFHVEPSVCGPWLPPASTIMSPADRLPGPAQAFHVERWSPVGTGLRHVATSLASRRW